MNINPISFKGIIKVSGSDPSSTMSSVDRLCDVIENNEAKTEAEAGFLGYCNKNHAEQKARSVTFDKYKTAYIVTGQDFERIKQLYDSKASKHTDAIKEYGMGHPETSNVVEQAINEYYKEASELLIGKEDITVDVRYNYNTNTVSFVDYIA